jgi:hypothetical protein
MSLYVGSYVHIYMMIMICAFYEYIGIACMCNILTKHWTAFGPTRRLDNYPTFKTFIIFILLKLINVNFVHALYRYCMYV